ncbi:MAG: NAD(P)H-hydrate dehydratase [Candidatus Shapirobacteria bacterium]|nr:NAD(P)H-hydrate dehydratase [Candidatus Shapirobacteria bacterium]
MVDELTVGQVKDFFDQPDFLTKETMVIGGSSLFHGAPFLSVQTASRFNKTVFLASPESKLLKTASSIKSQLFSFIWVPFSQIDSYVSSTDSVLIGPGLMRYHYQKDRQKYFSSGCDRRAGRKTKRITKRLLKRFPGQSWVVDAGSLQVIDKTVIPAGAIITPNNQEFKMLFGDNLIGLSLAKQVRLVVKRARENNCLIVSKNPQSVIASKEGCLVVSGGNRGLEKGGTGDVLAGLVMALSAGSASALLSSAVAVWLFKRAAEKLFNNRGFFYNADDLARSIIFGAREYIG